MSFLETVHRAKAYLAEHGRVSLRALRRELDLDEEAVGELVEELVDIQQVAAREGKVLSWIAPAPREARPADAETRAVAREKRAPAADRAPRDYTPKHLADKILQSKSALEGERKQVTVLFADVKGSMELAEQLDPEEWHRILDRFFSILTDGVHRFEGTVNQYTGDGIMALFGAPIAHENHAQRACYAALHLRDELLGYAETLRRESALRFSARIGLNSGEVVVGRIGDDLRMDYTAQGHCVGLAQRMEQLAEPERPYLAAPTAALVEGYFELEDLGEFAVKGADRVRAFALKGIGAQRHPLDRARRRGLSGFVGRDAELATLETALADARAGEHPVLGIVGEAGVGKSRLVYEFVERARAAGFHVLVGHCASHGKNVPLLGYLEMLRSNYGLGDRDAPAAARAKITQRFVSAYPELIEEHLPLICDFLGVPDPDRPVPAMTPEERQRQLLDWQRRVIQNPSREPLLTVMEDLHWADPGTEAMCAAITETRRTRQVFLTTYRPEYRPPWAPKSFFHQLPLGPLAEGPVDQLLTELLGREIARSEFAERLRYRCAGTPFFIEELIQSLAESGVLEGERGAYRLAKPIDQIPLPGTVQAVLAARIDRLSEREKQVLQTASVIGRVFPCDVLEAVTKDADVAPALQALMDAELVYEESVYPEPEYSFKHALVQDVAYASQLKGRREELHRRVADALEQYYAQQLDAKAALVA
jgi:class 3 adenylate cyclase